MNWEEEILNWVRENDLYGFDPYDSISSNSFTRSLMYPFKRLSLPKKVLFLFIYNLDQLMPRLIRYIFGITAKIHPTYVGMLLNAEALLPKDLYDENRILMLKNKLEELRIKKYKEYCWGTPFEWRSGDIFYENGTPFAVVNAWIGEAYLTLYLRNLNPKDLEVCESICKFFSNHLIISEYQKGISFSYSDKKASNINNANLMVASYLIRIGTITNNNKYVNDGISAAYHTISTQLKSGLIPYFGDKKCKHNDSYHSSYELKSLIEIYSATKDLSVKKAFDKYLHYYLHNYFHEDGSISKYPNKKFPIDGTAIADAFILFHKCQNYLDDEVMKSFKVKIDKTEKQFVKHWLKQDGAVKYKRTKWFGFVKITYKRWIMGWFAIAAAYKLQK